MRGACKRVRARASVCEPSTHAGGFNKCGQRQSGRYARARILRCVRGKLFLMRPIREVHVTNMIFMEDK